MRLMCFVTFENKGKNEPLSLVGTYLLGGAKICFGISVYRGNADQFKTLSVGTMF